MSKPMPKPRQGFFIELANPVRSFFPGQSIIGRVVVSNEKQRDLKNISITFEGKATVDWAETEPGAESKTTNYTAEEIYFTCKILLLGNESETFALGPGTTYYPFQFTLPGDLPSSFKSHIGIVHYRMKARMKRSWYKSDVTSIVPFTVNGILDLNTEIGVTDPLEVLNHKNICCCCCKSGPVGYEIKLPRNGFVPGEFATFSVEMFNRSRRKVNRIQVSLVQIATFYAEGRSRNDSNVICKAYSPSLEQGGYESWGGNILKIPPIPPTRLANCGIIDVQYFLNFEMDLSGPALNLKNKLPIVVGTIPLRNTFVDLMPSAAPMVSVPLNPVFGTSSDFAQPMPGPSAIPPAYNPMIPSAPVYEMYPDLPPPTYAETMQIDMDTLSMVNEQTKTDLSLGGGQRKPNMAYAPGSADKQFDPSSVPQSGPSAPPGHGSEYLPNYITYGFSS